MPGRARWIPHNNAADPTGATAALAALTSAARGSQPLRVSFFPLQSSARLEIAPFAAHRDFWFVRHRIPALTLVPKYTK